MKQQRGFQSLTHKTMGKEDAEKDPQSEIW